MLEKLNSASRSEFLKVWSMDHLHWYHIGQRFSNCSLGFIGHKINFKHFLKKNRKLWNRTEYIICSKSIGFYLCVYVYVLNRGIKSIS